MWGFARVLCEQTAVRNGFAVRSCTLFRRTRGSLSFFVGSLQGACQKSELGNLLAGENSRCGGERVEPAGRVLDTCLEKLEERLFVLR